MESIIKLNNHNTYTGLLNSNYKSIVKYNFKNLKNNSIFGLKQRLKSEQLQTCCSVATSIKLLVFFTVIIIAIN